MKTFLQKAHIDLDIDQYDPSITFRIRFAKLDLF